MAIDYRYHLASIIAVFVALLLGLLIGMGLAPSPEELNDVVSDLRKQYDQTRTENVDKLAQTRAQLDDAREVAKAAVAAVIADRLQGKRVAVVLDHEFNHAVSEDLRGWLAQSGAEIVSTTVITKSFIAMSESERAQLSNQLEFYPPEENPFRPALARALARGLASGRARIINALESEGFLRLSTDSSFGSRPDAVLIVGGSTSPSETALDTIDVPLIEELTRLGVRVVGCEASTAKASCISQYKTCGISTVDDVDTAAGRLAAVLALGGAEGHFGIKESADQLFPQIGTGGR